MRSLPKVTVDQVVISHIAQTHSPGLKEFIYGHYVAQCTYTFTQNESLVNIKEVVSIIICSNLHENVT